MSYKCVRVNVRARLAPISPHRRVEFILLCGRCPARCAHRVGVDARCTHLIRRIFIWMELHREPVMSCDVVIITCVMRQSSSSCPASERVMQRRNTHRPDGRFHVRLVVCSPSPLVRLPYLRRARILLNTEARVQVCAGPLHLVVSGVSPHNHQPHTPAGVHASSPSRLFFRPAPSDVRRRRDEKCKL